MMSTDRQNVVDQLLAMEFAVGRRYKELSRRNTLKVVLGWLVGIVIFGVAASILTSVALGQIAKDAVSRIPDRPDWSSYVRQAFNGLKVRVTVQCIVFCVWESFVFAALLLLTDYVKVPLRVVRTILGTEPRRAALVAIECSEFARSPVSMSRFTLAALVSIGLGGVGFSVVYWGYGSSDKAIGASTFWCFGLAVFVPTVLAMQRIYRRALRLLQRAMVLDADARRVYWVRLLWTIRHIVVFAGALGVMVAATWLGGSSWARAMHSAAMETAHTLQMGAPSDIKYAVEGDFLQEWKLFRESAKDPLDMETSKRSFLLVTYNLLLGATLGIGVALFVGGYLVPLVTTEQHHPIRAVLILGAVGLIVTALVDSTVIGPSEAFTRRPLLYVTGYWLSFLVIYVITVLIDCGRKRTVCLHCRRSFEVVGDTCPLCGINMKRSCACERNGFFINYGSRIVHQRDCWRVATDPSERQGFDSLTEALRSTKQGWPWSIRPCKECLGLSDSWVRDPAEVEASRWLKRAGIVMDNEQ